MKTKEGWETGAKLLALNKKKAALSKGTQAASGSWERKGSRLP